MSSWPQLPPDPMGATLGGSQNHSDGPGGATSGDTGSGSAVSSHGKT